PSPRAVYCSGEAQADQALASLESRRHWNEATPEPPASVPEKTRLALVLAVSEAGPESTWVRGAVASTVQLKVAGVASALPASSIARTSNLCVRSVRGGD